jgi:hypothetical protein
MHESVSQFFSALHRDYLKPRRYKKVRHTFSRDMGGYTERVQFQGSAWNNAGGPWTFYINFGVQFRDLPERVPCRDFPDTHCWTRIEYLVDDASKKYDIPANDTGSFAAEITDCLDQASQAAERQISVIRKSYEQTHSPRLTTKP